MVLVSHAPCDQNAYICCALLMNKHLKYTCAEQTNTWNHAVWLDCNAFPAQWYTSYRIHIHNVQQFVNNSLSTAGCQLQFLQFLQLTNCKTLSYFFAISCSCITAVDAIKGIGWWKSRWLKVADRSKLYKDNCGCGQSLDYAGEIIAFVLHDQSICESVVWIRFDTKRHMSVTLWQYAYSISLSDRCY